MGRVWHVVLCVVLVAQAAVAVTQPILAGMFLDGDVDRIGLHGVLGSTLPGLGLLALIAAVLCWRPRLIGPRHGPGWPAAVLVPLFLLEGVQIGLGHGRELALHIPFGVTIVATSVALAVWSVRRPARGGAGVRA